MDQHFMPGIVRFGCHFAGVRSVGQNSHGNIRGQSDNLIFLRGAITEVIYNDCQLSSVNRGCQHECADEREKHTTELKQNLSSQPRLWIDCLALATNFEIK